MASHSVDTQSSSKAMYRVSWRSVASHKVRLLLTVLAVVLGTAFVSGSMMFTKALGDTFDSAISSQMASVDAVVNGNTAPVTVDTLNTLREDSQVGKVNLNGSQTVVVATEDRQPFQTGAASPMVSVWYNPDDAVVSGETLVEGEAPTGADQVVVNEAGAKEYNITVGQSLIVVDSLGQRNVTVSGLYAVEGASHPSINMAMAEQAYLERYVPDGLVGSLTVAGTGEDPQALVEHLRGVYPDFNVETGETLAEQATEAMKSALSFVNYFLVAFGLIALLVGTFIIANTFSMIVAQRLREFALLRALGVSRPQLTKSVVFEAVIVGMIGSAIGILGGMGLVLGIQAVMKAFGMELPSMELGLSVNSVLVPFVLGVLVTVVSAWAPARKAGAVRPVEAMRSTETASESSLKLRTIVGALGILAGVGLALLGALNSDGEVKTRAIIVGVGAFLLIVGVFLASPAISIPVVGAIGRVVGAPFGQVGKLAATNSRRNPRRTATTAFALTLGVALVSAIGMLSATMSNSIKDMVSSELRADYLVSGPAASSIQFPSEAANVIAETEGVGNVVSMGMVTGVTLEGGQSYFGAGIPTLNGDVSQAVNIEGLEGSADLSQPNTMIAAKNYVEQQGWALGDSIAILDSTGAEIGTVEIIGTYTESPILGTFDVSTSTFADTQVDSMAMGALVTGDGSVSQQQLGDNLKADVADFLVVRVQSSEEYAGEQAGMVSQMMNVIYGLLGLAVVVAVLGIINTLALNVIERRQEIGMLRAVGTQRNQIRRMIVVESLQIALYGAVLGVVVGLGLGWAFLKALSGSGLDSISVPYTEIVWLLVGSGVVGVLAALWPARRAAKTPPLDAIAD
ncbi:ABC transporter permease [Corynebacterium sp. 70RC1]|uniref:ABC transporter permease n=2 Tax=unclassified Corynebacterium TaxID=2624378 RepID=UPI003593DD0D